MTTNSETCGADPNGWNVYRFVNDDPTDQEFIGSASTLEEAHQLARPGDQIQRGLDGAVEGV